MVSEDPTIGKPGTKSFLPFSVQLFALLQSYVSEGFESKKFFFFSFLSLLHFEKEILF